LQIEPLEDRLLATLGIGGVHGNALATLLPRVGGPLPLQELKAAPPAVLGGLQQLGARPPVKPNQSQVTVAQNAPETVIDLNVIFASSGTPPGDGFCFSTLGNTNSGLVTTDLSGAMLTLSYTPGQNGSTTITVSATDGDGVSFQQAFLVTVRPLKPALGGDVARK
jgi:hypothetical protein